MPRVIHFELGAENPERAVAFYEQVFGWKASKWDGPTDYWMLATGEDEPGIDGAIMRRQSPADKTINTIDVDSVDEFCARITANGGQIAAPKMSIVGVGYMAYCLDTEGNLFGIMQMDPSAP